MRLPTFEYIEPKDLQEALQMLHDFGRDCRVLGGGTDLLVRMKQRLFNPKYLLSLKSLHTLDYIRGENGSAKIGSRTSLAKIATSTLIQKHFAALVQAIQSIGAPTIQHFRGTIGGNLCQDTRCMYYNQSPFWRSGRQPCHKAGGQICYAKEGSDRCRSTHQSDGSPALIALGSRVTLCKKEGKRTIPLEDLYTTKGEQPLSIEPDEILTEIEIPLPGGGMGSAYRRLAYRSAIDYPIASAGVLIEKSNAHIQKARIVIGSMTSAPLLLAHVSDSLEGKPLSDKSALENAAALAMDHASAFAVENVGSSVEYRVQMVSVLVRRALTEAIGYASKDQEDHS